MQKQQLGHSDLYVSEVGLGTMSLGTDEGQALRLLETALDQGINYLDTADLYDLGLNEEFVGKIIKSQRQDIILATKVGNRWEEGKEGWSWDPSKPYIKTAVKNSLRRLQTDYIDLYQLHGGTLEDNIEETIEAFEELKAEGVIREYGISSIRPNVIREYVKHSSIVSVMMQYSLLDRRPEELFPFLLENNVSVIARGPLAKGLLTNAMKVRSSVEKNGYLAYSYEEIQTLLQKLDSNERSIEELAIRYCLQDSIVGAVIPGASKIEQIIANTTAASAPMLTSEEYTMLQQLTKATTYEQHR